MKLSYSQKLYYKAIAKLLIVPLILIIPSALVLWFVGNMILASATMIYGGILFTIGFFFYPTLKKLDAVFSAKVLYLSQEVYGVPLSIPFTAQNFGPYDGSVKKALTAGLSRYNNFFKKRGLVYTLGLGSSKLLQYTNSKLVRQMNEALDDLMPLLKKADSASIERLATVCKIIQDFQTTKEDEVIAEMRKWKGEKFSDEQVKKSLNFITTQGWDKKLITT